METLRIAAFSAGDRGGNPAGVQISDTLPACDEMQKIAADIGYSETVFACPYEDRANGTSKSSWRARYFSPESEVPFCGHATIALGAALASRFGDGVFGLQLNDNSITVEGHRQGDLFAAALQSPATKSTSLKPELLRNILEQFSYSPADLDEALPPAWVHAGADHAVIALNSRAKLSAMSYPFKAVRALMADAQLVTIMFVYSETATLFHSRNAFAYGGVVEDPATGAATAGFAGYLRDYGWPHGGCIELVQGEDMGAISRLLAEIPDTVESSIRVSGTARFI